MNNIENNRLNLKKRTLFWWCLVVAIAIALAVALYFSSGLSSHQKRNICLLFDSKPHWYLPAKEASDQWDISIPVMMAIMNKESGFRADAKPRKRWLWNVIPGELRSTAYGYSQALDATWLEYQMAIKNPDARRDVFSDAIDFLGWYNHLSSLRSKIKGDDAYNLYLAYHQGHQGFNTRSYEGKKWLLKVAREVAELAKTYDQQLQSCETNIAEKADLLR